MTIEVLERPQNTHPKIVDVLASKKDIVDRLAIGETCRSISKDYPVTEQRINQIKHQEREKIEKTAREIIESLPDIVESSKLDIKTNKELSKAAYITGCNLSKEQLTFKTITNKLSADILRSIGIFAAQTPGIIFNQFNMDKSKHLNIEPTIMSLFSLGNGGFNDSMQVVDMNEDITSNDKS